MRLNSDSGFTLVELLISITIFAIGVLAIVNMQLMSSWTNSRARGITEGIVLAQNKVEYLSALNYLNADLSDTDNNGDAGLNSRTEGTADHSDLSDPTYKIFWNVREEYPFENNKFIRIFVVWDDKNIPKWFYFDTIVSYK